jgi:hypothetical protein
LIGFIPGVEGRSAMNGVCVECQVHQEQYRDLLRQAETERLIRGAGLSETAGFLPIGFGDVGVKARELVCRLPPAHNLAVCSLPVR